MLARPGHGDVEDSQFLGERVAPGGGIVHA
jgi:hypothetical protein